eukprot:GHRR01027834.1.p1 GENE.GHRR01027834.1~~GHRR01027834.1.p1  ORF type:complete len:153 (-),score=6.84 GHRR01027834.1:318-776(-)
MRCATSCVVKCLHSGHSPRYLCALCSFAFGWVLLLTMLLILGTKESARFNLVVTIVHVVLVVFIIIAGLVKSNPANTQPFAPYGARGVFNGAAIVFFSYIGFDAVATSAEEVRVISITRCTILHMYCIRWGWLPVACADALAHWGMLLLVIG